MVKILNTWKSTPDKKEYYELNEPIYQNGDWAVFIINNNGWRLCEVAATQN